MDTITSDSELIPVRQAARLRGLYARRLWVAIREGALPAYQIGGWLRVRLTDVDCWIESMRVEPASNALVRASGQECERMENR